MNIMNKHIVFYSEGSGFYKYFKDAIEYLLANGTGNIHYVTNDPNDQIFEIAKEQTRIRTYYIGTKKAITLMMKMDVDIVCTTLEDLDTYYIKRSYVRKDIEYVFFVHHMTSMHLVSTETAYDGYDTVFCAGPHQVRELAEMEEKRNLRTKKHIEIGYPMLDSNIKNFEKLVDNKNEKPTILIGPSWQEGCIPDSCIDELIDSLLGNGWKIIVRPHPEYLKRYKAKWQSILTRWEHIPEDELYFEKDFSSNESVYTSDILITDWSSVAYEFSFTTNRPCIFVNTQMKVTNPNYKLLEHVPVDISWRDCVGVSIEPTNVHHIAKTVQTMLKETTAWQSKIQVFANENIFNIGKSTSAQGEYLLNTLASKNDSESQ